MERLKEKKQSVADALGAALDAVFVATSFSECLPDIVEFLKHKNPQVKQGTVKFLIRCLRTTRDVPEKGEIKAISEASTKLLTDSDQVTRAGGAEAMGTLMKIMGERAMNPYMEGLDDIRKSKIKEYFETAEVKAKDRPKPIVGPPKKAAAPAAKAPGTRKVVKKPAGTVKKPAPAPALSAAEEEPPVQLTSPAKPSAKGPPSRFGVPKPGSLAGPKLKRPAAPGGGAAAPPQLSSPRRITSPPGAPAEELPASSPQKFGLGRGGLTGRSLGRPPSAAPEAPAPVPAPQLTGLAAVEKAELEELRAERESLTKLVEELRAERTRMSSEINELQNQNAQLIEDHTRDVLSIKAKETQLVRAKSDAEAAEQTTFKQQREMERLKRELTRALRASAVSPPNPYAGGNGDYTGGRDIYADTESMHSQSSGGLMSSSRMDSRRSYLSTGSGGEDKENKGYGMDSYSSAGCAGNRYDGMPPPSPSLSTTRRPTPPTQSSYSPGQPSPTRRSSRLSTGPGYPSSATDREYKERRPTNSGNYTSGEPAENWKRAAEVTSQLKARIEQMKARQGLASRGHY
ncbi:Microtubule-associated protein, microtubule dynamics during spindle orientation [Ascosphaera atra]|nr:Microtubule-associated protein, microtubule dynamics during spindle orientation [Ascosphaera atra]